MCGIYGFKGEDRKILRSMSKSISHRGPDDRGFYEDKEISLGHNRLSIIDLSKKGTQPMEYEHKGRKIIISFNGEIYNFKELRNDLENRGYNFKSKTDTEVILASYLEFGEDCVKKFNGMWAFCIYEPEKKELFLSRDRVGIKPLYYYQDDEEFIFASEIKAILEKKKIEELDLEAFNEFISLRYSPGEKTLFKGIKKLLPGTNLFYSLKNRKIELKKYWSNKITEQNISESEAINELETLFEKSLRRRLISDVPLGLYLSGGLDSSAVLAFMDQVKKKDEAKDEIKTFSVGFEDGSYVDELPFAKELADQFSTKHKEVFVTKDSIEKLPKIVWHLDEPMADPALIPVYLLSSEAKRDLSVVLTGDGGDELFAGYDQYKFLATGKRLSAIPFSNKVSQIMKITPNQILNRFYKYSSKMGNESFGKIDEMIKSFKENNSSKAYYDLVGIFTDLERKKLLNEKYFDEVNHKKVNETFFDSKLDYKSQILKFDQSRLLPESFLMKTDRMTMAHSIEGRVPILDHEILEYANKLPYSFKNKNRTPKYALKKMLENKIPRNLIYRKKQSFHVPIENWLRNNLKDHEDSLLNQKEIKTVTCFNNREIEKIFNKSNGGNLFYARKAWSLVSFKIWHDKFM